jgi:hypothetical protein
MSRRRVLTIASGGQRSAPASAQNASDEAAVHDTIARYTQAWNRHDIETWEASLASEVDLRHYDWGEAGIRAAVQTTTYNVG